MATGRPTRAHADEAGVVHIADIDVAPRNAGSLDLRMAPQAKVRITLRQQLGVDRAVYRVTDGTTFA